MLGPEFRQSLEIVPALSMGNSSEVDPAVNSGEQGTASGTTTRNIQVLIVD